ncbi:hypothetical protein [Wolbachia endosymbiont (group A) of Tiphia femorata]|nr:hypothetical protein [Wolbachia endosymbiont (group A) of Tiphia femorata]
MTRKRGTGMTLKEQTVESKDYYKEKSYTGECSKKCVKPKKK